MKIREALRNGFYLKYSDFKSRSSRSEFWWFIAAYLLLNAVLAWFAQISPELGSSVLGGFALATLCPYASSLVRRLHDVGLSAWWVAAAFTLAVIGSLAGAYPQTWWCAFVPPAAFGLLLLIALLPGQKTANRFGPVPES